MGKATGHTITSDSALGDAKIQRSLRFNDDDSPYLGRTPSGAGSNQMTFSFWIKRGNLGGTQAIFSSGAVNARAHIYFASDDKLNCQPFNSSGANTNLVVDRVFRDTSAWYHVVLSFNNSAYNDTASTVNVYVNGVSASFTPSVTNTPTGGNRLNDAQAKRIGELAPDSGGHLDGYLAEFNFIDGQVLDPSYFGFTDPVTGSWMPRRYEGVYGSNGFYLDFSDNSSTTTLGIDKSPNGNDWSVNNFSVSAGTDNDSVEDTPTNNFPTLNPLMAFLNGSSSNAENGNLRWNGVNQNQAGCPASMAFPTTGKWYWEVRYIGSNSNFELGITPAIWSQNLNPLSQTGAIGYAAYGSKIVSGTETTSWAASFTSSDVVGVLLDMDNNDIEFYKNNSSVGTISLVSGYENVQYLAIIKGATNGATISSTINFGQQGFTYTPPTGFKALNANNLVPHSPSIVRPQKHFETLLYTGDGQNNRRVTGLEFKPDLVWLKARAQSGGGEISADHGWYDSIRGVTKRLKSNSEDAEGTVPIKSFDDGGFTFATEMYYNANASSFVAWCWKAGGAAVSNTSGSITSSVSANQEGGFSVVTWTGTNGTGTIGHGLGKAPKWIIIRRRDSGSSWVVYHYGVGNTKRLTLDSTGAASSASANWFNNTSPTSTTFSVGSDGGSNGSTDGYVAWCWADISGFSKFDKYTGNGSSDGVYVHLGFRPAWIMVKRTSSGDSWLIMDNKRDIDNPATQTQAPQSNREDNVNTGGIPTDFLSQGFKCRGSGGDFNGSGQTYIYMAFAEQPGVTPFDTFPNAR